MRILFIAPRFPYPPIRGDQVRSYHFLRLLGARHCITLVAPVSPGFEKAAHETEAHIGARIIAVSVRWWERIRSLGRFPTSSLPLQVLYFCTASLTRTVQELAREESFDLIHVQLARMALAVSEIDQVPKVLDFIDALSLNMRRRAQRERWPLGWALQLEAERMGRYEQQLISLFDEQVISSSEDKRAIGDYKSLHVISNGVSIEDFPYSEYGREDRVIVFSGRMGYFSNAEAAVYFATRVFPLIRREEPKAQFVVVGADPPRRVRRLARLKGVEVTGYVSRMHDYLGRATVAVAPMLSGTGIQNKVLEAMASGAPVVATPYAVSGIEAIPGEHVLVAEDTEGLAECVLRLLKDQSLRGRLARNARRLVEEKYTWERSVAALEQVYSMAVNKVRSRVR